MSSKSHEALKYPEVFAALGRFIAQRHLQEVCMLEFEGGIIVTGSVMYDRGGDFGRHSETHIFSVEDLQKLVKGL